MKTPSKAWSKRAAEQEGDSDIHAGPKVTIDRGPQPTAPLPWARGPEGMFILGPGGIVARLTEGTGEWRFSNEHINFIIHSCNNFHAMCDRADREADERRERQNAETTVRELREERDKAQARVRELEANNARQVDRIAELMEAQNSILTRTYLQRDEARKKARELASALRHVMYVVTDGRCFTREEFDRRPPFWEARELLMRLGEVDKSATSDEDAWLPPATAAKKSWGTCLACGRNVGAGCRTDVVGDGDPEDCQCDDPSLGVIAPTIPEVTEALGRVDDYREAARRLKVLACWQHDMLQPLRWDMAGHVQEAVKQLRMQRNKARAQLTEALAEVAALRTDRNAAAGAPAKLPECVERMRELLGGRDHDWKGWFWDWFYGGRHRAPEGGACVGESIKWMVSAPAAQIAAAMQGDAWYWNRLKREIANDKLRCDFGVPRDVIARTTITAKPTVLAIGAEAAEAVKELQSGCPHGCVPCCQTCAFDKVRALKAVELHDAAELAGWLRSLIPRKHEGTMPDLCRCVWCKGPQWAKELSGTT